MKKILYLFFTCSIIFAFAGCSPSKKDSAEATTTQEIATTTSTTENTTDSSTSDSDTKNDSYDFSAYKSHHFHPERQSFRSSLTCFCWKASKMCFFHFVRCILHCIGGILCIDKLYLQKFLGYLPDKRVS